MNDDNRQTDTDRQTDKPHTYRLTFQMYMYSEPNNLHCSLQHGGKAVTISSEEGIQQGDPFGAALFSVAIQPVLLTLQHNHVNVKVLAYVPG